MSSVPARACPWPAARCLSSTDTAGEVDVARLASRTIESTPKRGHDKLAQTIDCVQSVLHSDGDGGSAWERRADN